MASIAVLSALDGPTDELGQVLAVLRAAGEAEPERLTLARGDRRLLELHREAMGEDLELTVTCASCGTLSSVLLGPDTVPDASPRSVWLGPGGGLREPTYGDLRGLPGDPDEAAAELLRRCTVGVPGREPTAAELEHVDDSLAGPLRVTCAGCGVPVEAPVDVERATLESLERGMRAADVEVHLLAASYHWPLNAIDALPDRRRERLARLVAEGA